jgi:hypothetical protein
MESEIVLSDGLPAKSARGLAQSQTWRQIAARFEIVNRKS